MEEYQKIMNAIYKYYCDKDVRKMFCHGGCFYLASKLVLLIPDSSIMWNRQIMHCGISFDNGLFDITGRISKQGFTIADQKALNYMQKHFNPSFDTSGLDAYLAQFFRTKAVP